MKTVGHKKQPPSSWLCYYFPDLRLVFSDTVASDTDAKTFYGKDKILYDNTD